MADRDAAGQTSLIQDMSDRLAKLADERVKCVQLSIVWGI
jgi:hypothetical protein